MKTSEIIVGEYYAIRGLSGHGGDHAPLHQFRVSAVTSRKTGAGPSNIRVSVEGSVVGQTNSNIVLSPKDLLGRYTEFAELVDLRKKEADERLAKRNTAVAQAALASELLAELLDSPELGKRGRYSYTSVTIGEEEMAKFVIMLQSIKAGFSLERAIRQAGTRDD